MRWLDPLRRRSASSGTSWRLTFRWPLPTEWPGELRGPTRIWELAAGNRNGTRCLGADLAGIVVGWRRPFRGQEDVKKSALKFAMNSAVKKCSRMPYKRPPGCRQAFGIKNKIAKTQANQFFHIFTSPGFPPLRPPSMYYLRYR
jgi:hypothetical protein